MLGLFGERKRRRSRRRSREAGTSLFGERKRSRKRSRSRSRKHTKVGIVHAHKRRTHEPRRVSLFGGLGERKRRRSRSRRRSRERSVFARGAGLAERKRRRRSRSRVGKRVRTAARRALGFGERRRKRSRSRSRSRSRLRSRSRRRSREARRPLFAVSERKRRRSRSRSRRRSRSGGRRRSREIGRRPLFLAGLGERKRSRRRRRRSREAGLFGGFVARRNGEFVNEVLKPGAYAAVGLVGTRLIAQQVGKLTASIAPSSPTLARWVPTAVAGLSAWGAAALASRVGALRPYRRYLMIGAGLAVVEELLAVVLPMVGIAPGMAGLSGQLGNALYGVDGGMGFPCFTGSCPQGVALPFNQGMPCAPGGSVQAYMTPGQAVQQAVAPGAAAGMGFPCFTGSCPQGVAPGFSNPPCVDPNAVVAPAAANAVAASGFTDPVAQSVLAGLSGKADEIINASGVLR